MRNVTSDTHGASLYHVFQHYVFPRLSSLLLATLVISFGALVIPLDSLAAEQTTIASVCARALVSDGKFYPHRIIRNRELPQNTSEIKSESMPTFYKQLLKTYYEELEHTPGYSGFYSFEDLYHYFEYGHPIPKVAVQKRLTRDENGSLKTETIYADRIQFHRLNPSVSPDALVHRLISTHPDPEAPWYSNYVIGAAAGAAAAFLGDAVGIIPDQGSLVLTAEALVTAYGAYLGLPKLFGESNYTTVRMHNRKIVEELIAFQNSFIESSSTAAIFSMMIASNSMKAEYKAVGVYFGGFDFLFTKEASNADPQIFVVPWQLDAHSNVSKSSIWSKTKKQNSLVKRFEK